MFENSIGLACRVNSAPYAHANRFCEGDPSWYMQTETINMHRKGIIGSGGRDISAGRQIHSKPLLDVVTDSDPHIPLLHFKSELLGPIILQKLFKPSLLKQQAAELTVAWTFTSPYLFMA